jgi:hypothetical protein
MFWHLSDHIQIFLDTLLIIEMWRMTLSIFYH